MQQNATLRTIVTGLGWMGGGAGSIDTAIEGLVTEAHQELIVLSYAMSDGADRLLEMVRGRLMSNVKVTIVVNRIANQSGGAAQKLLKLAADYPDTCRLYNFAGGDTTEFLHAKVLIADRERAIVGSANLSWNGLVANHELCVWIEGEAVQDIAAAVDRLLTYRSVHREPS